MDSLTAVQLLADSGLLLAVLNSAVKPLAGSSCPSPNSSASRPHLAFGTANSQLADCMQLRALTGAGSQVASIRVDQPLFSAGGGDVRRPGLANLQALLSNAGAPSVRCPPPPPARAASSGSQQQPDPLVQLLQSLPLDLLIKLRSEAAAGPPALQLEMASPGCAGRQQQLHSTSSDSGANEDVEMEAGTFVDITGSGTASERAHEGSGEDVLAGRGQEAGRGSEGGRIAGRRREGLTAEEKKMLRLLQKRRSAAAARDRQKKLVADLQEEVRRLQAANSDLRRLCVQQQNALLLATAGLKPTPGRH